MFSDINYIDDEYRQFSFQLVLQKYKFQCTFFEGKGEFKIRLLDSNLVKLFIVILDSSLILPCAPNDLDNVDRFSFDLDDENKVG